MGALLCFTSKVLQKTKINEKFKKYTFCSYVAIRIRQMTVMMKKVFNCGHFKY